MSVLAVLGWVLVGLLGCLALLVALVVALPFHASAEGALWDGEAAGELELRWAFGLLGVRLDSESGGHLLLAGRPVKRLRGDGDDEKEEKKKKDEKKRQGPGALATLRTLREHRGGLLEIVRRALRWLHIELEIDGVVGTGDPSETALLTGLVNATLGLVPGTRVALQPAWTDEALELDGWLSARVWLAELLAVAAGLLITKETRAALLALERLRSARGGPR